MLQCVAVCIREMPSSFVACCRKGRHYRVLQCVAACCSVLQRVAAYCSVLQRVEAWGALCVAMCCSVLQCVALCCSGCSVLQCAATECRILVGRAVLKLFLSCI